MDENGTGNDTNQNGQDIDTIESAGAATAGTEKQDVFYDPNELPEELKPHWKRMQGTFTKKMQGIKSLREKAEMVDKFNADPDYAIATIQQRAQQLGLSLSKAQAAQVVADQQASTGPEAPQELVNEIETRLKIQYPELAWMAKPMANSVWAAQQAANRPIKQKLEQDTAERRQEEYDALADELTNEMPGWEEHEDEMLELKTFLESDKMKHPRFGSKLKILATLVTGNASAISAATQRITAAGRSRMVTGSTTRSSSPDISEQIRKAPSRNDAWDIAKRAALQMADRSGEQ